MLIIKIVNEIVSHLAVEIVVGNRLGIDEIALSTEAIVVQFCIGKKAMALDLSWARVFLEPQEVGGVFFEGMVPVLNEAIGHSLLDVGLLVCICSNASKCSCLDGRITRGRRSRERSPFPHIPLEIRQGSSHLLHNQLYFFLITLSPLLRLTPLNPESGLEVGIVRRC